jgi:hypothetical protein
MRWLTGLFLLISLLSPFESVAQEPTGRPAANAQNETPPAWEVELRRRHDELVLANGPGTDAELRDRLLAMGAKDQAAPERGTTKVAPEDVAKLRKAMNLAETDRKLTAELKEIVAASGWPTIAMVGINASNAAMLVLTHTRDHAWQLSLMPQLEQLASDGKIDGSRLATVVDKELVSEGKLQRYGSQFKFVQGAMAMYAVEDPADLDARRAKAFLPPMEVYKKQLSEMYQLKTTDETVKATPPVKTAKRRKKRR